MRFGTYIGDVKSAEEQAAKARLFGYTAVGVHTEFAKDDAEIRHYRNVAEKYELQLAEVGAWSNPLSCLPEKRKEGLEHCQRQLAIADALGARCCVNIAGSRGLRWDGPHPANLTAETFDLIVESVRAIIDAVKPARTFYTLETMPWMYPDSVDSYVALCKGIDRKAFAVHFDPVNLVSSPQLVYNTGALIRDFIAKLGAQIRSVHVKDIRIGDTLTVHLDECRPGLGVLDHPTLFKELAQLDPEIPVLMEHLPEDEYPLAAKYLRSAAASVGVTL